MPLAHNLNKVTKNLSKSTGSIHIKGRKFKQLNRATVRDKKLKKQKLESIEKKSNELLIVTFIQNQIQNDDNETYSLDEIKNFIEDFINIDREKLAEESKNHRKGRPISTKQKLLTEKLKHAEHLFETGYKVPDLGDAETVTRLRSWNGTTGATTGFKFIHITKSMKEFPTKEVEME
ncbi:TMA16 [Candida jiufengensis]|uniref:TMA16 n=1 Tax=Candida jiufengensis TaxID=497108 RepID=UPI0022253CBC|nr:TMA16 [Candida jiufengensis]KAI5951553.1 TMA16 [Candida jiufengensis]